MIIAIGGGEVSQNQTYDIDKFIVESSKKEKPNFLFIPTASKDAKLYVDAVNELYEGLGCETDTLYLSNVEVSLEDVNQKIESADIIYVGGGDTAYMMEVWEKYAVDKALINAYKSGKVLAGLSAGSICWFIAGYSDSEFIEDIKNPKYKWIKGLGIIPYLNCVHYDELERKDFDEFYYGQVADAIAIENQVAIIWDDYEINVIKSNSLKNAYRLSCGDAGLNKKVLI